MLKLKNICKTYRIDKNKQTILDNITLNFKNKGLIFILGASGSGKSTLLNIIGGNLKCDNGDIYFNNLCITKFKDKELDIYRRSIVSTIFQDYNLIEYFTVLDNILIGCHKTISKEEIKLLLKKLNIYAKKNITVNKLSGGEKQRVAVARTLINDSKILLADEPTGALDSKNSHAVMALLKQISKNKLVIVVTHNKPLAYKYGDHIITIKDGKCKDSKVNDDDYSAPITLNNKHRNFIPLFKLALKALTNKLLRNLVTALAISIGIISIILITNIYSNFNKELNSLEKRLVNIFPIMVKNGEYKLANNKVHINKIDNDYLDYLKQIKEIAHIKYNYDILFPVITDSYQLIPNAYLEINPNNNNYHILYGRTIRSNHEVLIKVDQFNSISNDLMVAFNYKEDNDYEDLIGRKVRVISNNKYFTKQDNYYLVNNDYEKLYENGFIELTIVGIVKEQEVVNDGSSIIYSESLIEELITENSNSNIVKDLLSNNYKLLGFTNDKSILLSYLGYQPLPCSINIYVDNLKNKKIVSDKLAQYKELIYEDTMSSSIEIVRKFILTVSGVLIIFSLLAIIVSSLMIAILTSIRVLESKKEIGILKSLGYTKKNIRFLFNLENMLIGLLSFAVSVIIVFILVKPGNNLIEKYIGINNLLNLNYHYLIVILIVNLLIIKVVSTIPVIRASKLDTVSCIYGK